MLSTPLICSSMGVATDCARVWASAPTNVACSFVSGGTILGNCEMGSPRIVMAPRMTVRIAISRERYGRDRAAIFALLNASCDDPVARDQTAFNHPHGVDALTRLHRVN